VIIQLDTETEAYRSFPRHIREKSAPSTSQQVSANKDISIATGCFGLRDALQTSSGHICLLCSAEESITQNAPFSLQLLISH